MNSSFLLQFDIDVIQYAFINRFISIVLYVARSQLWKSTKHFLTKSFPKKLHLYQPTAASSFQSPKTSLDIDGIGRDALSCLFSYAQKISPTTFVKYTIPMASKSCMSTGYLRALWLFWPWDLRESIGQVGWIHLYCYSSILWPAQMVTWSIHGERDIFVSFWN